MTAVVYASTCLRSYSSDPYSPAQQRGKHKVKIYSEGVVLLENSIEPLAMYNDPLSDVLSLIHICQNTVFVCAANAPFGIQFPAGRHRIHIIRSGKVVIRVDGEEDLIDAEKGDVVMLLKGQGHVISDQLDRPAKMLSELIKHDYNQEQLTVGQGKTTWLSGNFGFDGVMAQQLLSALPAVLVLKASAHQSRPWLESCSQLILSEAMTPQIGGVALVSRFLDVIFVQALRTWATENNVNKGWLSGALDARLSKAMSAIHHAPHRLWSVEELAGISSLSKSAFAERFQRVVGQSPLNYLNHWRLDRAAELLRHGYLSVAEVASQVGYTSDTAFSRSFKSRYGMSPLKWRKNMPSNELVGESE